MRLLLYTNYRTINGRIEDSRQKGRRAYMRYLLCKIPKGPYSDVCHYARKWISRIEAGKSYSFTTHFCRAISDMKGSLLMSIFHYIITHQLRVNLYGTSKSDRILQMIQLALSCRRFDEYKPENRHIIDYLLDNLGKKF